jgi:putative SOS response-associated peptidase YedK
MCSRFEINVRARDLFDRLGLSGDPQALDPVIPRAEVRPTDRLVCIRNNRAAALRWGWSVPWSTQPLINARAETLREKPTFRDRLEHRCIIPATAYFEWRRVEGEAKKRRNRIARTDGGLLLFAGLLDAEDAATIVTCAPTPAVAAIHSRMPALLDRGAAEAWVSEAPFDAVAPALAPPVALDLTAAEDAPPPARQGDLFG